MYARQITSEEAYQLAEARKIMEMEREEKIEKFLYQIKQKAIGLLAIGVSIAEVLMSYYNLINEGGISIIMLPVGILLLFTKKNII